MGVTTAAYVLAGAAGLQVVALVAYLWIEGKERMNPHGDCGARPAASRAHDRMMRPSLRRRESDDMTWLLGIVGVVALAVLGLWAMW